MTRNHRGWDFLPEVGLVLTGGHSCNGRCKFIKDAERTQDYGASFTELASLRQPVNQGGDSIKSRKLSWKIPNMFRKFAPSAYNYLYPLAEI